VLGLIYRTLFCVAVVTGRIAAGQTADHGRPFHAIFHLDGCRVQYETPENANVTNFVNIVTHKGVVLARFLRNRDYRSLHVVFMFSVWSVSFSICRSHGMCHLALGGRVFPKISGSIVAKLKKLRRVREQQKWYRFPVSA